MKFTIVSHAGLLVEHQGIQLVCDPWIIGSCYWRSWWNYPPVSKELVESLNPKYIYLTHIHWDHFHSISLRKIGINKKIIIPKGTSNRMYRDLKRIGFRDIEELSHAEKFQLDNGFSITSYQFGVFMDSAAVIECEGIKILNLNDSKFMGWPLKEIVDDHGTFDFVLRSHSSANSRLSYQLINSQNEAVDDAEFYVQNFADTVQSVPAKYCVPFASNQCHLHPEVLKFNSTARTPEIVRDYFKLNRIKEPQVKVMVSGDSWSSRDGFQLGGEQDFYANREKRQFEYINSVKDKLQKQEALEAKAKINLKKVKKYYGELCGKIPYLLKRQFKNKPFVYVLSAGDKVTNLYVDIYINTVKIIERVDDGLHPRQIHTATHIFNRCIGQDLFSHLSISKRVTFRVLKDEKKYIQLLNLIYNLFEYDVIPLRNLIRPSYVRNWGARWREIFLYIFLLKDKCLHGAFYSKRYLPRRKFPYRKI